MHGRSLCCHCFALDNQGFNLQVCQFSTLPELGLIFSIKNNAYLSNLVRQQEGGNSWQQSPSPHLTCTCHFLQFQQLSRSSPYNYNEKTSHSTIAPGSQDANVFPHKSLIAKTLKFFRVSVLCPSPLMSLYSHGLQLFTSIQNTPAWILNWY